MCVSNCGHLDFEELSLECGVMYKDSNCCTVTASVYTFLLLICSKWSLQTPQCAKASFNVCECM